MPRADSLTREVMSRRPRRRSTRRPLILLALGLAALVPSAVEAQARATATVVSTDLGNFYRAFDLAQGRDSAGRVAAFLDEYIRPGSPGLRDWALLRLAEWEEMIPAMNAAGYRTEDLERIYLAPVSDSTRLAMFRVLTPIMEVSAARGIAAAAAKWPRYYAGIRPRVLALDSSSAFRQAASEGLARLHALYPEGEQTPVYLLVGRLTSGGTVGRSGMLLGAEMSSRTPETPVDELSETQKTMISDRTPEDFVSLIVHEAVHTFQTRDTVNSLLSQAIKEGLADFLVALALPDSKVTTSSYQRYGRAHEARIWREFQRGMRTKEDPGNWLYSWGSATNHGSADLGYFVGYRICEAYYRRATDKAAAIRTLIAMRDPVAILRQSRYAGTGPRAVRH